MIVVDPYTTTIEAVGTELAVVLRTTVGGKDYLIKAIILRELGQTVAKFKEAVDQASWAVAVKVEMLQTKVIQKYHALEVTDVMELT